MTESGQTHRPTPRATTPTGQRLQMMEMRTAITVTLAAGVVLVAGLVLVALAVGGFPALQRDGLFTWASLFELMKLVFAVVAGIGGVVALVVAYRKQRVNEFQNRLAEAADERAALESERSGVRLFHERFTKAAEQLGSDKPAVRLAGVYAMAGLADDWLHGRQTCIDVLCAYLRMPYTPPDEHRDADVAETGEAGDNHRTDLQDRHREEHQVRHTVITVIAQHLRPNAQVSWCGHDFDFTGAVLDGGDFSSAMFTGGKVSFNKAMFTGQVSLADTLISGDATVSFFQAQFKKHSHVWFSGVNLSKGRLSFELARFSGGTMVFPGADFSGGELDFSNVQFSDGMLSFGAAQFSGAEVSFDLASFSGGEVAFGLSDNHLYRPATFVAGKIDFDSASFCGSLVTFKGAEFSGSTLDLSRPESWSVPPVFDAWSGERPVGLLLPPT